MTLREERSLRVFENRVLGKVFEPKRDEVTGEWRELAQDREKWRALVGTVRDFLVP
jgi:hypothetical protein